MAKENISREEARKATNRKAIEAYNRRLAEKGLKTLSPVRGLTPFQWRMCKDFCNAVRHSGFNKNTCHEEILELLAGCLKSKKEVFMQCNECVFNKPQFSVFCADKKHKHGLTPKCDDFKNKITDRCLQCGQFLDAEELFTFGIYCAFHAQEL